MKICNQLIMPLMWLCCANSLFAELSEYKAREIAEAYLLYVSQSSKPGDKSIEVIDGFVQKSERTVIMNHSRMVVRNGSIEEVDHNNVLLNNHGYIQITDKGEIKYDGVYLRHPVHRAVIAYQNLLRILDRDFPNDQIERVYSELSDTGIPTFGFSPELPNRENRKALKKIREWLKKNGSNWDSNDPKLPLPDEVFEDLCERYL